MLRDPRVESDLVNKRGEFESYFNSSLGIMLIKPDAVEHDLTEVLISHVANTLRNESGAILMGVEVIPPIDSENVPDIYPAIPSSLYPTIAQYLGKGESVLVTFWGDPENGIDLQKRLEQLKGIRMLDWTDEQLDGAYGMQDSIRAMLPLPGMRKSYKGIIENIKARRTNPQLKFTDEQYLIYAQNLLHTPGDLNEAVALLKLLSPQQLCEAVPEEIVRVLRIRGLI